jgi:hypothetical protein
MGHGQATQGKGLVLLPAWLRHCGTVSAGTEQVLTKKMGQEERTVEGMSKRREGDGSFIPFILNHFAFSVRSKTGDRGFHPHDFYVGTS